MKLFLSLALTFAAIVAACTHQPTAQKSDLLHQKSNAAGHLEVFSSRTPAGDYANTDPEAKPVPEDLSFAELKVLLQSEKISSIDALLQRLRQLKPDYMSRYALGFESRSLHGSSKEHPRAIIYGKTGNFIITFNGRKDQDAYEMLEVVEFNHAKNRFEFREIEFNEKNQMKQPYKISQIDGPLDPETKTPKCLACHVARRPIWETYPTWPGFYGAEDDVPMGFSARMNGGQTSVGLHAPLSVQTEWEDFVASMASKERYRHLPPLAGTVHFGEHYKQRPNSDLTVNLRRLNAKRIGQLLKGAPGAKSLRHVLLFAHECQVVSVAGTKKSLSPKTKATASELIYALGKAEKPVMDEAVLMNSVNAVSSLMRGMGFTLADLGKHYEGYQNNDRTVNEVLPAAILSGNLNAFLKELHRIRFETGKKEAYGLVIPLLSVVKKALPAAQVDQWPTALYQGVHRYDDGTGEPAEMFYKLITEFLFDEKERKIVTHEKERGDLCLYLQERFPNSWRDSR
jgi:hypothetical protein